MTSKKEFLDIFRKSNQVKKIPEDLLIVFHDTIKESVILVLTGIWGYSKLLKLEEDIHFPVLEMINDPDLDIYKGANQKTLEIFIKTINKEKEIRDGEKKVKGASWKLRSIINTRTELYQSIFEFTQEEIEYCEKKSKEYSEHFSQQRKQALLKRIGINKVGKVIKDVFFSGEKKKDDKEK